MEKRKYYYGVRFPASVIEDGHDLFVSKSEMAGGKEHPNELTVHVGDVRWRFDTREEFLAEYPNARVFTMDHILGRNRFRVDGNLSEVLVLVQFPARSDIEAVFQVFERNLDRSKIVVESEPARVFIGHGRDSQWRDLKDHLTDQHGLDVIAYEVGPRAGLSVKEVLEGMLRDSSFALLVLTGEDLHADGELHARENVVHELGLFQGRLGFLRAIAILEDDVKEFSNILGVNQIRFAKGRIRETFGDVVAAIKRELQST